MKVYYNDVDIYPDISLNTCIHDMYAEQKADTVWIRLNDTRRLWDGWGAKKEDTICISLGGGITGRMWIDSLKPENGLMTIRGMSIPPTVKDKSSKAWEQVNFMQLCTEIAGRHHLTCEFYGVEDRLYTYVCQQNTSDFLFLEERCVLEGCAFLVFNGRLIVYSEKHMEKQPPIEKIMIDNRCKFNYTDKAKEAYGSCIIKNGSLIGVYTNDATSKTYERVIYTRLSSQDEVNRFAKNILRFRNKTMQTGVLYAGRYLPQYAPGSVVNLEVEAAPSWNGSAFIYRVRHDYKNCETKLFFRKPLEGY